MTKVAFIKYAGLASGGTEKYIQTLACLLPKDKYQVDFFYTNVAPLTMGNSFVHPDNDERRKEYVSSHGVNLIPVQVGSKSGDSGPCEWYNTNFWDLFKESDYSAVQTARGGYPEYPFTLINSCPIIDSIHSFVGEDKPNIARAILLSKWQADRWAASGGNISKAVIIPSIVYVPELPTDNLRAALSIPEDAFVYGFHQGNRAGLFHPMSLDAFSRIQGDNNYFVIMGGDPQYRAYVLERKINNVLFVNSSSSVYNIHKFLNTLNVFAHSRADGEVCSACIIEALSHGLPVLSHPALNMGHVEQIGNCGIVTDSVDIYASELQKLESSRDYYQKKSSLALQQYNDRYDYKKVEKQVIDLYNDVCL